ncbi:PAS domain-containing sensor histidine kinase [Flavobacterium faecale]|nr:PAS domain-containing sensor histidine kinase [Flavobacterium faecale]
MLIRVSEDTKEITRKIGIIFILITAIQLYRLIYLLGNQNNNENYFNGDSAESLFILSWQIIVIFLAYSISLMYNKRLITELNTQEKKFSKAFHTTPFITILSKISDGKVFEVNNSIEEIAGYKASDLIGRKASDLKLWKNEKDREQFITTLLKNKIVKEHEYEFKKANGDCFSGLISAQIITINEEQCMIASVNDISIRKEAEQKLIESQESLRELNATKDKFFSIIAHDLRSPFNGIIGFTELLKSEVQESNYDGILEYAEIINSSSHHAMDLLTNLMEWTRSQTGRIAFHPKMVVIDDVIKETLTLFETLTEQKNIKVTLNLHIKTEQYVDQSMIEAILRNLISNAIKFTPNEGNLIISSIENENEFEIAIADSGIGIKEKDISNLFKIDNTHSSLGTNNEVGTGLGLILCKDFIDYHQGHISVKSTVGLGSTFTFSIPKKNVPAL